MQCLNSNNFGIIPWMQLSVYMGTRYDACVLSAIELGQEKICVADGTIDAIHHSIGCVRVCVYYVLFFVHSSVTSYFNQNVQLQYASLLRRMATTRSMNLCLFFYSSFCTLPLYRIALNWLGLLHWTWNLCHFGFIPNSFSSFPWNNKVMQHCISLFRSSNSAFARQHISHNMRLVMSVFVVVCVIFFYFFLDHALHVFSGAIVSVVL